MTNRNKLIFPWEYFHFDISQKHRHLGEYSVVAVLVCHPVGEANC